MIEKLNLTFQYYFIDHNDKINNALSYLNNNQDKCLVVIDKKNKLIGTLTDGDIRRSILKGVSFKESIKKIINKKPFFIKLKKSQKNREINITKNIFKNYSVVPIVDSNNIVIKIVTSKLSSFSGKKGIKIFSQEIPVIIMAGGEGKRLLPHTAILPKPLIPYNGKSMTEHIINRFENYGFKKFILTVQYKSKLMEAYFSDIFRKKKISFIFEKKPLGTAGSLKKLQKKLKSFFVINCDTLINCDYISLLNFHNENQNDLTIVASRKIEKLKYGSCEIAKNGNLKKIKEKPEVSFLANTGCYLLNSKILRLIRKDEKLDMNTLIERAISKKYKISVFPIQESEWLDLGTWNKF
jgi:dTDP-glucose pyrophosphorylase